MIKRFPVLLFLLTVFSSVGAQTPAPSDVHVKLSLAEKKTVYRIGEPIVVVMEFRADREGYVIEVLGDDHQPGADTVVISPDTGVTRWIDDLANNLPRHVFSTDKLSSSPKWLEISLNDRFRFDSPGRYTVSVATRRVTSPGSNRPFTLQTNPVSFEVQAMSDEDEAKEVKRLSELFATTRDWQSEEKTARQLSYLTGDPSTREKVRRFLHPEDRKGNYQTHLWYGLFVARNRALVLKLLESGMRDPNVPVTSQLLGVATTIKTLLTTGQKWNGSWETGDPRAREIHDAYVVELAASLSKRTGGNQTTTAVTLLSITPNPTPTLSAGLREARRILVQQLDALHPITQEWVVRQSWGELRDPALVPVYKKLLGTTGVAAKSLREGTLKRLFEMAPDDARAAVIAEIRDPASLVDPKVLGALEDKSLPEVDESLLDQVRRSASATDNRARVYLKFKAELLARFATDSIYQDVMDLYRSVGTKLQADGRAGLLAYLAKHNDREALPLIEEAVAAYKPGESPWILNDITNLYYSEAIDALLKRILETDDAAHASHVAYLLGKHGAAGDERLLAARLKRWREAWADRVAEADAQSQGQIERELIWALLNGKSWKLPPERIDELKKSCITQMCKQSNLVSQ